LINVVFIYQPNLPGKAGGGTIDLLRVVYDGEKHYVVEVLDSEMKMARVIAECDLEPRYPYKHFVFICSYKHPGHLNLCCLLREKGFRGHYREWLKAIDKVDVGEEKYYRRSSEISFNCDLIKGEEEEKWQVKMSELERDF